MDFVHDNVDQFLVLIREGYLKLPGDAGEPGLALVMGEPLRAKLAKLSLEQAQESHEKVRALYNILYDKCDDSGLCTQTRRQAQMQNVQELAFHIHAEGILDTRRRHFDVSPGP